MRLSDTKVWRHFDSETSTLVSEGGQPLDASLTSCVVEGLDAGEYECIISARNAVDWGPSSQVSSPVSIEAPGSPSTPWLKVVSESSIRVSWQKLTCVPAVTL